MKSVLGFTLIELMVVISMIAILSVVGVTIFSNSENAARNAKVESDFKAIYDNIEQARVLNQKTLLQLTGNACSDCACRTGTNISQDPACVSTMTTSYGKVTSAPLPIDPWGDIYVWDENEGESDAGPGVCRQDIITMVGPDHIYGTSDDRTMTIPLSGYVYCP